MRKKLGRSGAGAAAARRRRSLMQSKFKFMQGLVWVTQVGLSILCPLLLFILGAVWLQRKFALGGWVIAVGIALGLLGAAGATVNTFRMLHRLPDENKDKPVGFNDHD